MSLSRRARKQLIAVIILIALVALVGIGGNQLRLARNAANASEGLRVGTEAFERGDYPVAVDQLGRYLRVDENKSDADAIYMLAKARLEVPQDGGAHYSTALSYARQATDIAPDNVKLRLLILEVLVRSGAGTLQERLEEIDGILSLDSTRTDLRLYKADILRAADRTDDALAELRSIASRDPSSIDALNRITQYLADRPAEFSTWVAGLDDQAEQNPQTAAFDIARINARLLMVSGRQQDTATSALAVTRTLTAYDILTQSLLPSTITEPTIFRAALAAADEAERAVRLTRPRNIDEAQATQDRLDSIEIACFEFIDRHLADRLASGDGTAEIDPLAFAAMEWLWTSDREAKLREIAQQWRTAQTQPANSASQVAIEALITMTGALEDQRPIEIEAGSQSLAAKLWAHLAEAAMHLRSNDLPATSQTIEAAITEAIAIDTALLLSPQPIDDRDVQAFLASAATPALSILRAEAANASGDTARAINFWIDAARQRRAWDLPALQLLNAYRSRGSIADAEQMSNEAMLRGATLGTGLSMLESRVEQYALGLIPFEAAEAALRELRAAGLPPLAVAVAEYRLAIAASLIEPDRFPGLKPEAVRVLTEIAINAEAVTADAELLVRMLRVADQFGVLTREDYLPSRIHGSILQALAAQFDNLSPESKYQASLAESALTGVYGPALSRLNASVDQVLKDPDADDQSRFEHQRALARFVSDLARTYQALENDAYQRTLSLAEAYPDNAAAQLLFIDSLLRQGEPARAQAEPLSDALLRLRDILGPDTYTYNFAESRRLYANPQTRTSEVARQEIISRLDRFVEGPQAGSPPVELLHLVSKWWELLPGSLDRRLRYLRQAQRTSPTAWGIYPDLIRALVEAREFDDAATALLQWRRQLAPSLDLRAQRRDLAQFVGERWSSIAAQSSDPQTTQTLYGLWSLAIADASAVAQTTGDPSDRLREAQILVVAPDAGPVRDQVATMLNYDQQQLDRITNSRPRNARPEIATASATVTAAVRSALAMLNEIAEQDAADSENIFAIAGAATLIASQASTAELTDQVATGSNTDSPATAPSTPDIQTALDALASATRGSSERLLTRATSLFFVYAFDLLQSEQDRDRAREAFLAACDLDDLTENERRALVAPLSRLGQIDQAVRLQRSLASADAPPRDRITDVIAIAEILRNAGQSDAAYQVITDLPEDLREQLTATSTPPSTQALVALLELETAQPQTPVKTAFLRRLRDQPRETFDAFSLAVQSAAEPSVKIELLNLASDDLANISESRPSDGEFRSGIALLWFNAANATSQDDPARSELFAGAIQRFNAVAESDDSPEARFFVYQHRGYCEIELGQIDAGIRTYRQAIDINGSDPATLNNLADALNRREQYAEARNFARRAVEAAENSSLPDSARSVFHDTLGKTYIALGENDLALQSLRTAIEFDPANTQAKISLAEAMIQASEPIELIRTIIEPIGPAAEQELAAEDRERLASVRSRIESNR